MDNNTLQHHGTPGMKWGFRRYQNKDGTLTAAGKKRYAKELEKVKAKQKAVKEAERTKAKLDKLKAMQDDVAARKLALKGKSPKDKSKDNNESAKSKPDSKPKKSKKSKQMTDEELKEKIARLELEKKYESLMKETNPPKSTEGRDYVVGILKNIGKNSIENIGSQAATHALGSLVNKIAGKDNNDTKNRVANPQKGQADKK